MHSRTLLLPLLFGVILAVGCEKKDPHDRQPLTGTVTFQGKPLDQGRIEFLPVKPEQTFSAGGIITDGKYQIPREQGLPPGTYRVKIMSAEANTKEEPGGPPGMKMPPLGKERIPARYNIDSQEMVEVKGEGTNTFNFTIP